ncbi:MAG TPA: YcxB family protein [Tepidisphaeraceae bacterium]|jgi:hypothetical protein|nr:YcxB family protein [Tepidisphaeraceae bacterium]
MTLEFDYTWDDFRNASRVASVPPQPPAPRSKQVMGLIVILVVIAGMFGGAFACGEMRKDPIERLLYTVGAALMPTGMLVFILDLMLYRRSFNRRRPHPFFREPRKSITSAIMICCMAIAALAIFSADPQQCPRGVVSLWERYHTAAIWVAGIVVVLGMLVITSRRAQQKQARDVLMAHSHVRVDISEDQISFDSGSAANRINWAAVPAFIEGPSVFIIYLTAINYQVIPKRVMSPSQIEELRQLLLDKVQPQTGAFPVTPTTNAS